MNLQHRVQISVANVEGQKKPVLGSGIKCIPQKLFKAIFGEFTEVIVLNTGQTVKSVEIHEIKEGGCYR